jgi:DNA-binding IclR family transcriptional regulator
MNSNRHRGAASLDKSLDLLAAILADGGERPVSAIAAEMGLPASTAHRISAVLLDKGFLASSGGGYRVAGPRLVALGSDWSGRAMLEQVARAPLRALARRVRATAHLGVLEGGMVTYVLKAEGGHPVMTREGAQLEAYASGIGKVLLAHLSDDALRDYLESGPFIALTTDTLTCPSALLTEVGNVRSSGLARDNAEVESGLYCLAAPVVGAGGETLCAISISRRAAQPLPDKLIPALFECAARIGRRLGGS